MKAFMRTTGVALTVPFVLMACAPESNGGNDSGNDGNAEENNGESASTDEVEELAEEYGLTVSTGEPGDLSEEEEREAQEVSLDELEEAFEFISTAQESEQLEFQESSEDENSEQVGTAVGTWTIPGIDLSNDVETDIEVTFDYELEGDLDDEERYPSFAEVSDISPETTGADLIHWITENAEANMAGAGTIAEIFTSGTWDLLAEYDGVEINVSESDEWIGEFSTDEFMDIDEEEQGD